jgi:acetylornithine/succinyldiaminopimelate/putrescine aminotransferase
VGIELSVDGAPIVTECMRNGFLINCIQDKVLRLAPPLIIEKQQIDALVACLDRVLP